MEYSMFYVWAWEMLGDHRRRALVVWATVWHVPLVGVKEPVTR
jgi:hypothetical protein